MRNSAFSLFWAITECTPFKANPAVRAAKVPDFMNKRREFDIEFVSSSRKWFSPRVSGVSHSLF
jgi:hypothetical protein